VSSTGLTTAGALARRLDGCFDNNNNSADIQVVAAAVPRNSASTVNTPCPTNAADIALTAGTSGCDSTSGVAAPTFMVTNLAGSPINGTLTITVPPNLTFVSSTPTGTFASGTLTVPLTAITQGSPQVVTVNVAATISGSGLSAMLSTTDIDVNSANNGPVNGPNIFRGSTTPVAATPIFIVTDPAGSLSALSSDVPSLPSGTKFLWGTGNTEWLARPFVSSDGTKFISRIRTNQGTTADDALLVYTLSGPGAGTATVVARQGFEFVAGSGELVGDMDQTPAINNAGDFTFSTTFTGTSTQQAVLKSVGGTHSVVARPGNTNGLLTGTPNLYSATNSSFGITNVGGVAFHTTTGSTATSTTATSDAVFLNDGSLLLAREGTVALGTGTVPGNQAGGTTWQHISLDSGSAMTLVPFVSGDGAHTLVTGTIDVPTGTDPDVLVFDGNVQVQGGATAIASGTVATSGITSATARDSHWLATGTTTTGALDWILKDGVLVGLEGNPFVPAGSENLVSNFGAGSVNSSGNWVATSFGNNPTNYDDALVHFNGTHVVLRENDPIDLDGNGSVDGYVRTFRDSRLLLTDDNKLYIVVEVGSEPQPCGTGQRAKVADVLLRLDMPGAVTNMTCCRGTTCSIVTSAGACTAPAGVGVSLPSGSSTCNTGGSNTTPCCFSDFNKDGTRNIDDIFIYLNAWFGASSNPYAKIGGNGTDNANIDDLFVFINVWFAGGCG
jgi:hypothetical protein